MIDVVGMNDYEGWHGDDQTSTKANTCFVFLKKLSQN